MRTGAAVILAAGVILSTSCAVRRLEGSVKVLPATPSYLLRAPDASETPFPELLNRYTGLAQGWVDLQPQMDLRIENAYFRDGVARRGLEGYLGTEVARYSNGTSGKLKLVSIESGVPEPPKAQPPVQRLITESQARYRFHRYYYQILFKSKGDVRGAVLLGASSRSELARRGMQLVADPDAICGEPSAYCTIFPSTCTVSLEMEIAVNGTPRTVLWGTLVSTVASDHSSLEVWRTYHGRLKPIEMDPSDGNSLRMPLLPGDHINWR